MAQEEFLEPPLPDILAQWRFYFGVLRPEAGDTILDVGCNTGEVERFLLQEYPDIRQVVGVEISPKRYERAVAKWQADGAAGQIRFELGDARQLPFADDYFDRALCAETLEYVDPPQLGLAEIKRVLKPGGAALIVHTDYETQVFSTWDRLRSRRVVAAFADAGPLGTMGRQLLGLCRQAGFAQVELSVYCLVNTEWQSDRYSYRMAHMMVEWLKGQPGVAGDELNGWLVDLETCAEAGCYCYAVSRFVCRCVK
jgi:ubiquinone/menaquinone biosynthesis C-methylase UbiE